MTESPRVPFRAHDGVEDWRLLGHGPQARYRCASLAEAVHLASAISDVLEEGDPAPDLDLRRDAVTVHLRDHDGVSYDDRDLDLARRIQAAARSLGVTADPASLRSMQLAVAHAPGVDVRPFWQAVLGMVPFGAEDAMDPQDRGWRTWFHEIGHGRPGRGRTHVDVYVPAEEAERVVAEALAAGGRIADDSHAPDWWTLASPDGHGVDIAPWPDRT